MLWRQTTGSISDVKQVFLHEQVALPLPRVTLKVMSRASCHVHRFLLVWAVCLCVGTSFVICLWSVISSFLSAQRRLDVTPPEPNAGLAQCTLYSGSLLPSLSSSQATSSYSQIGSNWARASSQDRTWHSQQYQDLLKSLPDGACPAAGPATPWVSHLPTACTLPDLGAGGPAASAPNTTGFTAVCKTWLQVKMTARYRITLEVDSGGREFAAWAGVITSDPSGDVRGVSYMSARGAGASGGGPDGTQWGATTVLLGNAAARASEQSRWYYVSSVLSMDSRDPAQDATAAVLRRWGIGLQAVVDVAGGTTEGCEAHGVDFLQGVAFLQVQLAVVCDAGFAHHAHRRPAV